MGTARRGSQQHERLRGAQRIEVTRAEARGPAPDRHEREIEPGRADLAHPVEEIGVTRVIDAARACDHEAERGPVRADDAAAAVVARLRDAHRECTDGDLVTRRDLAHCIEAAPQQQAPAAARNDEREVARDPPQRGQVEVVAVQVGDQHGVEAAQCCRVGRRNPAPQMRDAVAQERVRQQAHAVEIDQRGAMADPRHLRHASRVCSFPPGAAG